MGGSVDFEPLASVRSFAPYEVVGKDKDGKDKDAVWRVESPMPFPRRFFAAASWRAVGGGMKPFLFWAVPVVLTSIIGIGFECLSI